MDSIFWFHSKIMAVNKFLNISLKIFEEKIGAACRWVIRQIVKFTLTLEQWVQSSKVTLSLYRWDKSKLNSINNLIYSLMIWKLVFQINQRYLWLCSKILPSLIYIHLVQLLFLPCYIGRQYFDRALSCLLQMSDLIQRFIPGDILYSLIRTLLRFSQAIWRILGWTREYRFLTLWSKQWTHEQKEESKLLTTLLTVV